MGGHVWGHFGGPCRLARSSPLAGFLRFGAFFFFVFRFVNYFNDFRIDLSIVFLKDLSKVDLIVDFLLVLLVLLFLLVLLAIYRVLK